MKIQELFERDIHRPINGVVKADQLDESSVWQELDEFVVTRELTGHIHRLVEVLLGSIESEASAADRNAIWISGFFGSGKSHFIKVLSYVLENEEHHHGSDARHAIDFFEEKLDDAVLFGDLKRVVEASVDTILFNIDSKADHATGRDALLRVFLKVLNEKQGYCGDYAHIAHIERHLENEGVLEEFHRAFEREAGSSWIEERDAWEFHRDELIAALTEVLDQSRESVEALVDNSGDHFSLSVENFAKWVKEYLDRQDADHRVMFLVDEVGQFIGNDTHLMLNLQTIAEQLGTVCAGRAWIVVTAQEDLDAVLGDLTNVKQHDFSKIQGRFKTRLSLSSANVDEVIKTRLLQKKEEVRPALQGAYQGKGDILRNQLSFTDAGMSFKQYADEDDFADCYPVAPYQFTLVQKVFESIRKAGATGLHLSQGERSTLDAFQGAIKGIGTHEIGTLIPFYAFYPSVEGFLEGAVKRTITQAGENPSLEPFDATILKVLFLIRYIDELPGSVENLVTLCVDEIDADKLKLRKRVEESLARLEAETLIARNGDLYLFLTNEERDIGREIKSHMIQSGAEERALGTLLFEDILNDARKHTYSKTGKDFSFTRICDDQVVGNRVEGGLEVVFASPLGDRYPELSDDAACIMETSREPARVLVRLPDDTDLARELRTYLQTEAYVKTRNTAGLPETTKRILRDRAEDNRARRARLKMALESLLAEADYFASGTTVDVTSGDPKNALGEALNYQIENAYPKMGYIAQLHPNPQQELQTTLRANDIEQVNLTLEGTGSNAKAMDELREYIRLASQANKQMILADLVETRFGQRPYGWPDLETLILIARLAVLKEITLVVDAAPLPLDRAYDHLVSPAKRRKVIIRKRESADDQLLKKARDLGKDLFGQKGPAGEDALFNQLQQHLQKWNQDLESYRSLASTGDYPGKGAIEEACEVLKKFVQESESLRFLRRFVDAKSELMQVAEQYQSLHGFYTNQKPVWDQLRRKVQELTLNRLQLGPHHEAGPALMRMEEILQSEHPYGMLHEVADLIHTADEINQQILSEVRKPAAEELKALLADVDKSLEAPSLEGAVRSNIREELLRLLQTATEARSVAHIKEARDAGQQAHERAMRAIQDAEQALSGDGLGDPPLPSKTQVTVSPRELWPGGILESPKDIRDFLQKLKAKLEETLDEKTRIQIR